MPKKIEQFMQAAKALGIEVRCDPNWDERRTFCITFLNVFDIEGDCMYIMLSSDGHVIKS